MSWNAPVHEDQLDVLVFLPFRRILALEGRLSNHPILPLVVLEALVAPSPIQRCSNNNRLSCGSRQVLAHSHAPRTSLKNTALDQGP
eukprot:4675143-Amphidinium_carterae.1